MSSASRCRSGIPFYVIGGEVPPQGLHRLRRVIAVYVHGEDMELVHSLMHTHGQRQLQGGPLSRFQGGRTDHRPGRSTPFLDAYFRHPLQHQRSIAVVAQGKLLVQGPVPGDGADVNHLSVHPEARPGS